MGQILFIFCARQGLAADAVVVEPVSPCIFGGRALSATIVIATLSGLGITLSPLDPIKALFWSAVINGVVSVPVMAIMMLISVNKKIMGKYIVRGALRIVGWIATIVMAVATAAMIGTSFWK
jgi:Mn2+/Fe2+ NRAMP family transporter